MRSGSGVRVSWHTKRRFTAQGGDVMKLTCRVIPLLAVRFSAEKIECGHVHRTYEAARKCSDKMAETLKLGWTDVQPVVRP